MHLAPLGPAHDLGRQIPIPGPQLGPVGGQAQTLRVPRPCGLRGQPPVGVGPLAALVGAQTARRDQGDEGEEPHSDPGLLAPGGEDGGPLAVDGGDQGLVRGGPAGPDGLQGHQAFVAPGRRTLQDRLVRAAVQEASGERLGPGVKVRAGEALGVGGAIDHQAVGVDHRGAHVGGIDRGAEQQVEIRGVDDGQDITIEMALIVDDHPPQADRPEPQGRLEGGGDVEPVRVGVLAHGPVAFLIVEVRPDQRLAVAGEGDALSIDD